MALGGLRRPGCVITVGLSESAASLLAPGTPASVRLARELLRRWPLVRARCFSHCVRVMSMQKANDTCTAAGRSLAPRHTGRVPLGSREGGPIGGQTTNGRTPVRHTSAARRPPACRKQFGDDDPLRALPGPVDPIKWVSSSPGSPCLLLRRGRPLARTGKPGPAAHQQGSPDLRGMYGCVAA